MRDLRVRSVRAAAIVAGLVLALVAGWGGSPAQAQSRQETLVIARNIDDYVTNDVHRTYEYTSQILDHVAYDTLVTVEAPDYTKILPNLATKWEVAKDGLTYTFTLRSGAKFTSGNPVTADDVRFSLRRLKYLKDNPSFFMDPVKDIEAVNPTTVKITLKAPDASFLAALAAVPCGIADAKTLIAKGATDAEDAKEKDKATEYLNNTSEGSGPYKLVSFAKNVEAVLERNPNYWGPKPYFAKVIIKHVPNGTTQREMVERGDADVAHDLDADLVAKITPGGKIKLVEGLSMNQVYLGIQNSPDVAKELSDKKVRQAISYAIDYDGIIKGLIRGAGDRPPAMLPIGVLGVDKAMNRQRDVAKAKQLLTEAGVKPGTKIPFIHPTGRYVQDKEASQAVAGYLREVGIEPELATMDWPSYISIVNAGPAEKTTHHLAYLGWAPNFLDASMQTLQFWSGYHPPAGLATSFYKDARVDELVVAADRESNPEKRKAMYCDLSKKVWSDAPWLFLYVQRFPIVYSAKVTDVGSLPIEKFYAIYVRPVP